MKLTPQITAIIIAVVLGGSFFITQSMKQNSIERQMREQIAIEEKKIAEEKAEKASKQFSLSLCLDGAEETYWNYIRLNGTPVKGKEDTWSASARDWDEAQERKEAAEKVCFSKYK